MTLCPHDDDSTTCPPCNRTPTPPQPHWETSTSTLYAQFSSNCPACDTQILEGDEIVKDDGVFIHAECLDPWG